MTQVIRDEEGGLATQRQSRREMRVPPHDIVAEESLLGAMLLSRDAIAIAVEHVGAGDFYKPAHAHVFDAICAQYASGEPADPVTVADTLRRSGLLDAIGGPQLLVSLQANTPAITNAARYARIVSDHATLRRLIGAAGDIAEMSYDLPEDVDEAVDRAETLVFEIAQRKTTDTIQPLKSLLEPSLDRLEMLVERGATVTGVPTGYNDLDELLAGLQKSNLIVVGARPAMGKTAWALGAALHAATTQEEPVLFFSLEMGHLELTQRLLASEARIDSARMRVGKLDARDWERLGPAIGRLSQAPLYLDETPHLTVMDVRAKARRLKSKLGHLGLIVIDYLQLMTGRSGTENRQLEVSEMSRGLKILARELETPVIALSQLSRGLEQRVDKRPMLADLRESGCLTPDTRICRADTGAWVPIGELCETGAQDIPVWTLNDAGQLVVGTMTHAFSSGVKDTFELRLRSGRRIKASANHPFLTRLGWRALGDLEPGSQVAVPANIGAPQAECELGDHEVALLAHLFGSSGFAPCTLDDATLPSCDSLHYVSDDNENLTVVEGAVRRFGVHPRRVWRRDGWDLTIAPVHELREQSEHPIVVWLRSLGLDPLGSQSGLPEIVYGLTDRQVALFLNHLGATDQSKKARADDPLALYALLTRELAEDVQRLALRLGHDLSIGETTSPDGNGFFVLGVNRPIDLDALSPVFTDAAPLVRKGEATEDARVQDMSDSSFGERSRVSVETATDMSANVQLDVNYDDVLEIVSLGPTEVFDATVNGTHNFLAEGIVVHNSIEQDADVVLFLYRDEVYDPNTQDKGIAEVIVAKHRNGPTGRTKLAFLDHYAKFANMARQA